MLINSSNFPKNSLPYWVVVGDLEQVKSMEITARFKLYASVKYN